MSISPRHMGCLLLPLIVAAAPTPSAVPGASTAQDPTAVVAPQITSRYEVRLRKLHLVRPDLIPYPIAYEVHC